MERSWDCSSRAWSLPQVFLRQGKRRGFSEATARRSLLYVYSEYHRLSSADAPEPRVVSVSAASRVVLTFAAALVTVLGMTGVTVTGLVRERLAVVAVAVLVPMFPPT